MRASTSPKALTSEAAQRIRAIHALSRRVNDRVGERHFARLMALVRSHVQEIGELRRSGDPHAVVETGDLLVLVLELLLEQGAAIDPILFRCFDRYDRKLGEILDRIEGRDDG